MQRLAFYLILLVPLFMLSGFARRASLDTALQNLYSTVRFRDEVKKLPDTMHHGDIFAKAYKIAKHEVVKGTAGVISQTTNYLNDTYTESCDLDSSDTTILLYQNKELKASLNGLLQVPSADNPTVYYDAFYASCVKLNKCIDPKKYDKFYTTTSLFQRCVAAATEAYFLSKQHTMNMQTMKDSTYGENIFVDGDPDNGPFDLLVDIKYIGDVLFKDNKPQPEMVFFQLPTVKAPSSQTSTPSPDLMVPGSSAETSQQDNLSTTGTNAPVSGTNANIPVFTGGGEPEAGDEPSIADDIKKLINTKNADTNERKIGELGVGNSCAVLPEIIQEQKTPQSDLAEIEALYEGLIKEYHTINAALDSPMLDLSPDPLAQAAPDDGQSGTTTETINPANFPVLEHQLQCKPLCNDSDLAAEYDKVLREGKNAVRALYRKTSRLETEEGLDTLINQTVKYIGTITSTVAGISYEKNGSLTTTSDIIKSLVDVKRLGGSLEDKKKAFGKTKQSVLDGVHSLQTQVNDIAKKNTPNDDKPREKEICEVNCCTQTCKANFKGADRLVCISQCLCGEFSGPNKPYDFAGVRTPVIKYRVRFCRIPTTSVPIVPKKVQSIEEIIDELQNIFVKLKESGQLMRHDETKEMFDTRLKTVKFGGVLAFNLFIKFKPIFDVIPESEIIQERKQDNESRKEELRGDHGDMSIKKERNKYIVAHDTASYNAGNEIATNYTMYLNNQKTTQEKDALAEIDNTVLIKGPVENALRSKTYGEVVDFVQNNQAFRNGVTEAMILFNDTANDLKIKVKEVQ